MDRDEVVEVLNCLANGACPETGEVFDYDAPYHSPLVIRSLFHAIKYLEKLPAEKSKKVKKKSRTQINKEFGYPRRAYEKWLTSEDEELRKMFGDQIDVEDIAEALQRQDSAIKSRLVKLGLMEPENS